MRNSTPAGRAGRALAALLALALVAAACSSATDDAASSETEEASTGDDAAADGDGSEGDDSSDVGDSNDSDSESGDSDDGDSDDGSGADDGAEATDLFSPTETDRPLDLSGGVQSGDDGVTIVTDDPRAALGGQIQQATEPWPTDWTRQTVGLDELLLGLPRVDPRDGIPPIDVPKFEPIAEANWLDEREPGALVRFNDEVRFYPLSILTRHELVNDRFGDIPVAVSYCPLCNTALSFDTRVDGEALRFGVSGLLRNSDLVMWDDATTTLWQQVTGEAIVGELAGTQLDVIPTAIVSYGDALESFPDAWSLSQDTGFGTAYGNNPYEGYSSSVQPFLFDGEPDPRFPALSRVVGVVLDGSEGGDGSEADKAYPFSVIEDAGTINDEVAGVPIVVWWGGDTADALDSGIIAQGQAIGTGITFDRRVDDQVLTFASVEGTTDRFSDAETGSTWTLLGLAVDGPLEGTQLDPIPHRNEFWFAWASFFPDAPVYES
ncbi:MAG: DUF3179 domain-containing protein [Actinomycetota bacterium]